MGAAADRKRSRTAFHAVALALLLFLFNSSCLFAAWTCTGAKDECDLFEAAVVDARDNMVITRAWSTLTPITEKNPNLIWKDNVVGSKVLVAAYRRGDSGKPPFDDCRPGVPFPKDCPLTGNRWVTVVPELSNFFRTHAFYTARLEQLLGLPPRYGANYIVEYWVDPKDLFRPALDPSITYSDGKARFYRDGTGQPVLSPGSGPKVWDDYCVLTKTECRCCDPAACNGKTSCSCDPSSRYKDYKCWFQDRREWAYSFDLPGAPYPWTGLGYTYDWGNPDTHVGLSEFVLNKPPGDKPFIVTVQSVTMAPFYLMRDQQSMLTIEKTGLGSGSVTAAKPVDLRCNFDCPATRKPFDKYARIRLIATPEKGSVFTDWGGACSGSSPVCTLALIQDLHVTARFAPIMKTTNR